MNMKKMLAVSMSAAMVMGMAMPVMAADTGATQNKTSVDAPIYSFEVLDVVVPTKFDIAFNPDGLTVDMGGGTTSTDQILSRNFGIINKGNKDQVFKVGLQIEDKNTGDDVVTFVGTESEVDNADANTYAIYLEVIPADTTEVKVGATPASADENTAAADLNDVTMTKASTAAVALNGGNNQVGFMLEKAVYTPVTDSEVTLGTTTGNDVTANYEVTNLATNGKGITAFTFGGKMNSKANWSKLQNEIKISAVYDNEIATDSATTVTGTGAMINLEPQIDVSATGLITISNLSAAQNFESMTITLPDGRVLDIDVNPVTWDRSNWSQQNGGSMTGQMGTEWVSYLSGQSEDSTITLNLTDQSVKTATVSIS